MLCLRSHFYWAYLDAPALTRFKRNPTPSPFFLSLSLSQCEMVDSDGETTRTNGGVGADGGVPRPIEIEVGPSASEGELTLYSVICDFLAGVVLPPPEASPPAAFLRRLKFSYYKASPCLREASRNSARDLLLWTRRGGSPRALFVIAVRG